MVTGRGGAEEDGARSSCEDTGPLFTDLPGSASFNNIGQQSRKGEFSAHHSTNSVSTRSIGRRKAIVPTGSAASPLPHGETYALQDLYYVEKEKTWRVRRPVSLFSGMFNCLCRSKEATSSASLDVRRINSATASTLLQQSRLHQEALVETEETRDMWEWQMEQQQALTCQEHDLIERRSLDYPYDLARNSSARRSSSVSLLGELSRSASAHRHNPPREQEWITHASPSRALHDPDVVSATALLFESALLRCRSEVNIFCRVYMQQMVLSGYSLVKTLMDMEPNTVFPRKVHASYALESRIYSVMFRCFENDSFDDTGLTQILDQDARALARLQDYFRMKSLDPEEALAMQNTSYDPSFHQFCANKSEEIASMFSWNMAYRNATERDRFMEAFLRAAKWVWLLHRLANSTNPPMQIIRVGRGMEFHPVYVDAVAVPPPGSCPRCSVPKVEFMIMPGFIAPKTVFKSKVYQHYMCKGT